MKNLIIVTGGAGFVGSNLIELLLNKTNTIAAIPDATSKGQYVKISLNRRIYEG